MKNRKYRNYFPSKHPEKPALFTRPMRAVPYAVFLDRKLIPNICMTEQAHGKMMALVQECPIEIGWLASCKREGMNFVINDVFVPNQECTMASTRITKDGMANLFNELRVTEAGKEAIRHLQCWGHSHVDMDVFASGTDERQTNKLLMEHHKKDHYIRLIANKRGEMFASVYLLDKQIAVHHPNLLLPRIKNPEQWTEWAKREIAAKVVQEPIRLLNLGELEFELHEVSPKTLRVWHESGLISHELYDNLEKRKVGGIHGKTDRY